MGTDELLEPLPPFDFAPDDNGDYGKRGGGSEQQVPRFARKDNTFLGNDNASFGMTMLRLE
jgi:hypothetical protein